MGDKMKIIYIQSRPVKVMEKKDVTKKLVTT